MAGSHYTYASIVAAVSDEIADGRYDDGAFPSLTQLTRRFSVARATAQRALAELRRLGLVMTRPGSGTRLVRARKIGLIVPGVAYTEFFPPIVGEISRLAQDRGYVLLFADVDAPTPERRAAKTRAFAERLVAERVSGVIYQPLELQNEADAVNREVLAVLSAARIPVVLLDYDIVPSPQRSAYDVVGINNADAGYRLASHLLAQGARKIHFLMRPNWAPSVRNRLRGMITAVTAFSERSGRYAVLTAEPDDLKALKRHLRGGRPDVFICGNDTAAAVFKQTLDKAGLRVPDDVLLAGFDDVRLASLLTPPLASVRQPCVQIGAVAFERLVARMQNPALPAQEIYLPAPLVVRASTTRPQKAPRRR